MPGSSKLDVERDVVFEDAVTIAGRAEALYAVRAVSIFCK